MFQMLTKVFGGRSAAKATKAVARRARPEVESLDQRILLSASVPNLQGDTMYFASTPSSFRSLQILSEHDNGNGTGTFVGGFSDAYGTAQVSGTIAFSAAKSTYQNQAGAGWNFGSPTPVEYDFQLSYSGVGASYYGGLDFISGSGDFKCDTVSNDPTTYGPYQALWTYSGSDDGPARQQARGHRLPGLFAVDDRLRGHRRGGVV